MDMSEGLCEGQCGSGHLKGMGLFVVSVRYLQVSRIRSESSKYPLSWPIFFVRCGVWQ